MLLFAVTVFSRDRPRIMRASAPPRRRKFGEIINERVLQNRFVLACNKTRLLQNLFRFVERAHFFVELFDRLLIGRARALHIPLFLVPIRLQEREALFEMALFPARIV